MGSQAEKLNRAQKFLMDRDRITEEEAAKRFENFRATIVCGPDIASSPTLQAALLTAVNVANRVRRGSVRVAFSGSDRQAKLVLPWPAQSIGAALNQIAPEVVLTDKPTNEPGQLVIGTYRHATQGLQLTFDGWCAAVGPITRTPRLPERERCVLAGVLAGALAVSELFMATFEVNIEAARRNISLSLWRPDLQVSEEAVGPKIEYLCNEFWCLGLGHLGQAYLWCIGLLPYAKPEQVKIILQDFDRTSLANLGTCALTTASDLGIHKTRLCRCWLEGRGFLPTVVERRFDEHTLSDLNEPALALCGFDGQGPRHLLDDANFRKVVECELGGRFGNFESILLHSLP